MTLKARERNLSIINKAGTVFIHIRDVALLQPAHHSRCLHWALTAGLALWRSIRHIVKVIYKPKLPNTALSDGLLRRVCVPSFT